MLSKPNLVQISVPTYNPVCRSFARTYLVTKGIEHLVKYPRCLLHTTRSIEIFSHLPCHRTEFREQIRFIALKESNFGIVVGLQYFNFLPRNLQC